VTAKRLAIWVSAEVGRTHPTIASLGTPLDKGEGGFVVKTQAIWLKIGDFCSD